MIDMHRSDSAMDFENVYTRGFFRRILSLMTGRSDKTRLLSFDEVRKAIRCHDESYGGMQTVPVDAIVGSLGRYNDFDREFLPLRRQSKERWRSIDEAYYQDVVLPPVQLYKVGDVYFVKDGNHRVSVAKERGIAYVDAEVIETRCRVPIPTHIKVEDLEEAGEHALFLEWSQIDELRPEQDLDVTIPGGYHDLEEHINIHRHYLSQERKEAVPLWDAVAGWYDNVYMPIVREIRNEKILAHFPKRTETDLYLWIMEHLHELRKRYGDEIDAGEADEVVSEFVRHRAKGAVLGAMRWRIKSAFGKQKEKTHD
jgi:hypothetical protein